MAKGELLERLEELKKLKKIYLEGFKQDKIDFRKNSLSYKRGELEIEPVLKRANQIRYHFLNFKIHEIQVENTKNPLKRMHFERKYRSAKAEHDEGVFQKNIASNQEISIK